VGATAQTFGGRLQFPGSTSKIMAGHTGSLSDVQTQATARLVLIQEGGAGIQSWFVGEGIAATHQGQAILQANEPITIAVKGGSATITTLSGSASSLATTFWVPQALSSLTIDGQPTAFQQSGQNVSVGTAPTVVIPYDDRIYAFTDNIILDATVSPNWMFTATESATSSAGTAEMMLRPAMAFGGRPVALGMSLHRVANGAQVAGLSLITPSGDPILDVSASFTTNDICSLNVSLFGQHLATGITPLIQPALEARWVLEVDPKAGLGRLADASGVTLVWFAFPNYPGAFRARAWVTPLAAIDLITVFDSAEDGLTPQGVVTFASATGRGGVFLRSHQPQYLSAIHTWVNGIEIEPVAVVSWFISSQVTERLLTPTIVGGAIPSTLTELGFESQLPWVPTGQGTWHGFAIQPTIGPILANVWAQ
jgi:hypothetical protein